MVPAAYAAIIVLVLVLIAVAYLARKSGCQSDTDCPAGQSCLGGSCQVTAGQCSPACTAPSVCQYGACVAPSSQCSPTCVAPQVCVDGACQTPQSCFAWQQWVPTEQVPAGALGYNLGTMLPVGAQLPGDSTFYLGGTDMSDPPGDPNWGVFYAPPDSFSFAPNTMFYLGAAPGCTPTLSPTTDPTQAVQFNSIPVCWDFSQQAGAFSAYDSASGACDQWPAAGGNFNFQLIADQASLASKSAP